MTYETPIKSREITHKDAREVAAMGLYPYFREISAVNENFVTIKQKKVLMLGSNSYLGLTNHPEVRKAAIAAIEKYGTGCSGSRFLNGSLDIHRELEEELADLVDKEKALVFSTGFQANLGAISVLVGKNDYVVTDKLDHASIVDGCRLSFGSKVRFRHNDMEDLERVLKGIPLEKKKLVVVDGVFSMEGDVAKLPESVVLCRKYNSAFMVDDAHGIGVLGKHGAGTADHFKLSDSIQIIMGTFSKSLASLGGFIASDTDTIEHLKHCSRPLMFSASMSPPNVAAARIALRIMRREPERLARLWENTGRMKAGLRSIGYDTGLSETPIIPVRVGGTLTTFKMCTLLFEEGVFVNPIIAPAVSDGDCLLRLSLMATHTPQQIDFALEKLEKVGNALGVIGSPRSRQAD